MLCYQCEGARIHDHLHRVELFSLTRTVPAVLNTFVDWQVRVPLHTGQFPENMCETHKTCHPKISELDRSNRPVSPPAHLTLLTIAYLRFTHLVRFEPGDTAPDAQKEKALASQAGTVES